MKCFTDLFETPIDQTNIYLCTCSEEKKQVETTVIFLCSSSGTSIVPFQKKRLTHMSGWMALIPNAKHINWYFKGVDHITNITYTSTFYGFKVNKELHNPSSVNCDCIFLERAPHTHPYTVCEAQNDLASVLTQRRPAHFS